MHIDLNKDFELVEKCKKSAHEARLKIGAIYAVFGQIHDSEDSKTWITDDPERMMFFATAEGYNEFLLTTVADRYNLVDIKKVEE